MRFLLIATLLLCLKTSQCQFLKSEIKAIFDNPVCESIYLHFDRTLYAPGDTVWFKAYILAGRNLSYSSTNFFIEFFNASGVPVKQLVYPIVSGSAAGFIKIDQSLKTEFLFYKAYTRQILDLNKEFVTKGILQVIQSESANSISKVYINKQHQLSFFPEGGDMIKNVDSYIAFKAVGSNGIPVKTQGVIINNSNETLAKFSDAHNGMGKFILTPRGDSLWAVYQIEGAPGYYKLLLPQAQEQGVVFNILKQTDTGFIFRVKRGDMLNTNSKRFFLLVHSANNVFYEMPIDLSNSYEFFGSVKTTKVESGVLKFTLFSEDKLPVAERIVFINAKSHSQSLTVSNIKIGLGKRALNEIEIGITDTVLTNMSVAVVDEDLFLSNELQSDIITSTLLENELTGSIYQASYYLSDTVKAEDLDLLMLTHGWRRYSLENEKDIYVPFSYQTNENYITLEGSVKGLTRDDLVKAGELNLAYNASDTSFNIIPVDLDNNFNFQMNQLLFTDSLQVSFAFAKPPGKNYQIEINSGFSFDNTPENIATATGKYPLKQNTVLGFKRYVSADSIKNNEIKSLKEIIVKGKQKSQLDIMDETYTTGFFRTDRAVRIDVMNDPYLLTYTDVISYLRSKLPPGIQVSSTNGSNLYFVWRNALTHIYLNEQTVDAATIADLSINQIAYIKVLRPIFLGLPTNPNPTDINIPGGITGIRQIFGTGGAICVYTKRGNDPMVKNDVNPSTKNIFTISGYSLSKEFYSPDYSLATQNDETIDTRKTLYWNQAIILDSKKRKEIFRFYNNDFARSIRIIIQGIDAKGRFVYYNQLFK